MRATAAAALLLPALFRAGGAPSVRGVPAGGAAGPDEALAGTEVSTIGTGHQTLEQVERVRQAHVLGRKAVAEMQEVVDDWQKEWAEGARAASSAQAGHSELDAEKPEMPSAGQEEQAVRKVGPWDNYDPLQYPSGGQCSTDTELTRARWGKPCLTESASRMWPGARATRAIAPSALALPGSSIDQFGDCTAPGACSWCGTKGVCCKAGRTAGGGCDGEIGGRWPMAGPLANAETWFACVCQDAAAHKAPRSVIGDPFTLDKDGNKVQFFLPRKKIVHLLQCDSLELHGRAKDARINGERQQWFDRIEVYNAGSELTAIEIKQLVASAAQRRVKANADRNDDPTRGAAKPARREGADGSDELTTLNVTIGGDRVARTGQYPLDGAAIGITQNRSARIGSGFSETADIVMWGMRLQISSASAGEFASAAMQTKHSHLDLRFAELDASKCISGMLAEIWGFVPMSRSTTKMLDPRTADSAL